MPRGLRSPITGLEGSDRESGRETGELQAPLESARIAELALRGHNRVLEKLAAAAPLDELLEVVCLAAEEVAPGQKCSVLLLSEDKQRLFHGAAPSLPDFYNEAIDGVEIGPEVGSCGTAAFRGERVIVEDVLTHPYWERWRDLARGAGFRACWSEPIRSSTGEILGTFAMYFDKPRRPLEHELEIIRTTARAAGIAIERKQAEEAFRQAQKLESVGVLAGGIAHDFNNLLAVILGNTSLALDTPHLEPALAERLLAVRKAARRGADLVEHLLAYAGRRPIAPRATDPNAVLEEMRGLLDPLISKTSSIGYELSPDVPLITADATQVLQVVMNLVTNATESFGPSGGDVLVSTGLIQADEAYLASAVAGTGLAPGDCAYIEVADTGCGMDAPTLARIFDPFFTTKQTGRGLGLAAVLGIVRAHGGALRVQSSPGCGSRFSVLFPPLRSAEVTGASQSAGGGTGPASGVILVVDDDEDVRGVLEQTLCRAGFEVLSAGGARRAVDLFRSKKREISAVLVDLVMAHMDGVETLRAMRRERDDVPAILVSGFTGDARIARFRELGFQDFVQKPFKPEALLASLRAVLIEQPITGSPTAATASHSARAGR